MFAWAQPWKQSEAQGRLVTSFSGDSPWASASCVTPRSHLPPARTTEAAQLLRNTRARAGAGELVVTPVTAIQGHTALWRRQRRSGATTAPSPLEWYVGGPTNQLLWLCPAFRFKEQRCTQVPSSHGGVSWRELWDQGLPEDNGKAGLKARRSYSPRPRSLEWRCSCLPLLLLGWATHCMSGREYLTELREAQMPARSGE